MKERKREHLMALPLVNLTWGTKKNQILLSPKTYNDFVMCSGIIFCKKMKHQVIQNINMAFLILVIQEN